MPKKTRRQKMLAQKKRLLNHSDPSFLRYESIPEIQIQKSIELEIPKQDHALKLFFLQDLKKSVIFISGIIVLEILIYFASIIKYLRLGI